VVDTVSLPRRVLRTTQSRPQRASSQPSHPKCHLAPRNRPSGFWNALACVSQRHPTDHSIPKTGGFGHAQQRMRYRSFEFQCILLSLPPLPPQHRLYFLPEPNAERFSDLPRIPTEPFLNIRRTPIFQCLQQVGRLVPR
jgi:hypothetical protein